MNTLPRPLKFLASIRMGVPIIIAIAVLIATGTIVEARFDSQIATKLVYHSIWMYLVLGSLSVCLIAVMVDRLPWKKRHTGFILAHIGILFMLFGSWVTQKYGVDGSMVFEIGQARRFVAVTDKEIAVYAASGSPDVRAIYNGGENFIVHPPSEKNPHRINVGSDVIDIVEYSHFAFRESEMQASDKPMDGPAIRFQLENERVNLAEWLRKDSMKSNFVASDDAVFLGHIRLKGFATAVIQIGLLDRYLKANPLPDFVVGLTNGDSPLRVVTGEMSFYELINQSALQAIPRKLQSVTATDLPILSGVQLAKFSAYQRRADTGQFQAMEDANVTHIERLIEGLVNEQKIESFIVIGPGNSVLKSTEAVRVTDSIDMDPALSWFWRTSTLDLASVN